MLEWDRPQGLPILENGNSLPTSKNQVEVDGEGGGKLEITVEDTCAFDSLFQLFLAVANDIQKFYIEYVRLQFFIYFLFL